MKYYIKIWGCQMNEHDSEVIAGLIENRGYLRTEDELEADLIILYTCCVREKAEAKVLGYLGAQLKRKRRSKPDLILGVGGCMTQQEDVSFMLKEKFDVDIIFGTHNLNSFDEMLGEAIENRGKNCYISKSDKMEIRESTPIKRNDDFKAFVNIIYGCNNYCSYCIVPYVRGREISREVSDIVREVKELLDLGYKDITLLGQNVNSFGNDHQNGDNFSDLLKELDELGDYRLRFMSSHPKDFTLELVDTIKNSKNVVDQFHLPFQSGSNRILKEMNRGYTREEYLNLTKYIKKAMPNSVITADIIVGFPGESEEDFLETLSLVKEVAFDQSFMFIYSVREGTRAEKMENKIPIDIKKERFERLMRLQHKISEKKNKDMVGKVFKIFVEGKNQRGLNGRTTGGKLISFVGNNNLIGKFVSIKVTKGTTFTVEGDLVKEL